jgi:hypothetical protein
LMPEVPKTSCNSTGCDQVGPAIRDISDNSVST